MEMNGKVSANGEKIGRLSVSSSTAENGEGGASYGYSASIVSKDVIQLDLSVYGDMADDGASYSTVSLDGRNTQDSFGLYFDVEISADAFEDKANAAEPAVVIDDLSDEAMSNLFQDQEIAGLMAKGAEHQQRGAMLAGERLPIEVEDEPEADYDYTYEIEGDDGLVIDGPGDGEQGGRRGRRRAGLRAAPVHLAARGLERGQRGDRYRLRLGGHHCDRRRRRGEPVRHLLPDMDGELINYTVSEDGTVQQARAMTVSDYGEGGMNVIVRENGIYGSLSFAPGTVDVDTIGQIVAGIEY